MTNAISSHENAPATILVCVDCACCMRPLVDAVSVETGVGPECRKRHGWNKASEPADWVAVRKALGDEDYNALRASELDGAGESDTAAHKLANILVHRISYYRTGDKVRTYVIALGALGFAKMARRIATRLGAITVEDQDGMLLVKAPYSDLFRAITGAIPGVRYEKSLGGRLVPMTCRARVWEAIRAAFPGMLVVGRRVAIA